MRNGTESFGLNPLLPYVLHRILHHMGNEWPDEHGNGLTRTTLPRPLAVWQPDDDFTSAMATSCHQPADRLEA